MIYMIWSIEHNAWWRPEKCGYTDKMERAGLYREDDAKRIIENANIVQVNEVMIPSPDMCAMLAYTLVRIGEIQCPSCKGNNAKMIVTKSAVSFECADCPNKSEQKLR